MAKVSAYTAASEPLVGTEELYVVQGGNGRKTTVNALRGGFSGVNLQTAQTATGSNTEFDFTGVPTWVNRITVTGRGLSTTGTSPITVRVGDGAVVASGYLGGVSNIGGTGSNNALSSTGCAVQQAQAATSVFRFACTIHRVSGNVWVFSGTGAFSDGATTTTFANEITLTGALDRVRVTTVGGADAFDLGSVSISWE